MPRRDRERLVRVAVAENAMTAHLIKETLAGAGIRCIVKNRYPTAITGPLPGAYSDEVYVLESDATAASTLLGGGPVLEALPPPAVNPAARTRRRRRFW